MTDDLATIAADYFEFRLRTSPTWAHQISSYRYAGTFEDVSRAAEDAEIAEARGFAARAEGIPPDGLDPQDRITRDMLVFDATTRADLTEARLAEIEVDPISGPQAMLPVLIPKLSIPSAAVAEAMIGKFHGIARMFVDLGERHREGAARGRTPPVYAVRQTIKQLDAWLGRPVDDDPLLDVAEPIGVEDPAEWRERLRDVVAHDVRPALAGYRAVLHDEILPRARANERCGLAWLPDGGPAYERAIRLHTTRSLVAAGDPRHRAAPAGPASRTSTGSSAPSCSGRTISSRSSSASDPTRRSTTPAARRSSQHRRRHWPGLAPRWANGSVSCRRPDATSRRP